MTGLIVLIIVIFLIAFIFKELGKTGPGSSLDDTDIRNEYKKKTFDKFLYKPKRFLTDAEFSYFRKLEEQYGKDYYIIPQVVLSSIIDVDMSRYYFAYKGYRTKIDKKTLDFVIFDKLTFAPVLAIELDDRTHERPDRVLRDEFVNTLLEKVNIKIERVKNIL